MIHSMLLLRMYSALILLLVHASTLPCALYLRPVVRMDSQLMSIPRDTLSSFPRFDVRSVYIRRCGPSRVTTRPTFSTPARRPRARCSAWLPTRRRASRPTSVTSKARAAPTSATTPGAPPATGPWTTRGGPRTRGRSPCRTDYVSARLFIVVGRGPGAGIFVWNSNFCISHSCCSLRTTRELHVMILIFPNLPIALTLVI